MLSLYSCCMNYYCKIAIIHFVHGILYITKINCLWLIRILYILFKMRVCRVRQNSWTKLPIKWHVTFKNVIKEKHWAKWTSVKDFWIIGLSKLISCLALTGYYCNQGLSLTSVHFTIAFVLLRHLQPGITVNISKHPLKWGLTYFKSNPFVSNNLSQTSR